MKYLLALLISGALAVSGYSQTRNVLVNSNNAVVSPTNFWSVDAANARTGLGLGTAATNPASAFQPSSGVLSNLASSNAVNLTNLRATNIIGTIPASNIGSLTLTNITGTLAISNGGTGAIDAPTARTNLGLGSTNDITNRALVLPQADGLSSSTAYGIQWRSIYPSGNGLIALSGTDDEGQTTFRISTGTMSGTTAEIALFNANRVTFYEPLSFNNTTNAATTRTNLGLGWAALTNTSASGFGASLYGSNTNPVLVNTNGEVVSPTNFWQAAPINTALQNLTNIVANSTNAATNARMLFLYSLAPTVTNVTSTITLPTNGSTFGGDVATITHLGPTSSVTAIRPLGAGTNIITLNQPEESVRLIYRDNGWALMDNISYIEPIYFSGTNAAANAAASITNLGLGWIDLASLTNAITFKTNLTVGGYGSGPYIGHSVQIFGNVEILAYEPSLGAGEVAPSLSVGPVEISGFTGTPSQKSVVINTDGISFSNNASGFTRTNLGLGATNNVTFNDVVASGTLTATSTVTAKTNLVVEGFVDFSTNHTNVAPATNNQIQKFLQIRIGTNAFFLPLYQ